MVARLTPAGAYVTDDATRSTVAPDGSFLALTTSSGSSATLAVTLDDATLVAAAQTVASASLAVALADVALSAAAAVGIAATLNVTLDDANLVAAATVSDSPVVLPGDGGGGGGGGGTTPVHCQRGTLLTETLRLRSTTQLGAFAEEQPLPHRYGDLRKSRFRLLKMTPTKWFAADHPMAITRVFVGNLETRSFEVKTEGADGFTWTVVNLAAAAPPDAVVTACGLGKTHAVTGALIENPADIAADILALAGRSDAWFGQLRSEASIEGIALAGSINAFDKVQAWIDQVVDSAGGMWCYGMAQLYPLPIAADTFVLPLAKYAVHDLKVSAAATDTADRLRLSYDYDDAEGRAQSYLELAARPARYGALTVDVTLPWLRGAAAAEKVGRRILGRKAGERFDVSFKTDTNRLIRPGRWVLLQDHPSWPFAASPYVKVLTATIDGGATAVTGEALLSTPTIDVVAHSLGVASIGQGGVEVAFNNGVATFTVLDADDKPLSGAQVSLDGAVPNKTNEQGKVAFITTRGAHTLAIEAEGFVPLTIDITI